MKKCLTLFLAFAGLLVLLPSAHAQARPTATGRGGDIQAGVGFLYLKNDYTDRSNKGATVWVDYDFTRFIGIEGTAHFGGIIAPDDIGENSYLVGPRVRYRRGKFELAAKLQFGRATISNQLFNTSSSYNIYAFGGTLDYRIARKFKVRGDYEIQKWGNFEPNTLSPSALSVGVLYVIR